MSTSSGGMDNTAFEDQPAFHDMGFDRRFAEDTMETIDLGRKLADSGQSPLDHREEVAEDQQCGVWFFRPQFLQRFRTPRWVLFWLCWVSATQGMVVNGFVNVVITTIERRYGLRSSESGLIAGGYDIASFLLLVPVSYYGGRDSSSKPRWIAIGVLVMGLGSLVFVVPQFTVGAYRGGDQGHYLCHVGNATLQEDCSKDAVIAPLHSLNLGLFVISQLLTGAGAAPLYTLGVTYLDENVTKKMSSVYLGIYYTASLIGPAVGYLLGGELLKIYTDFLTQDPNEFGLTPDSRVWVGAWWLGFVLAGTICIFIALPIVALPRSLPGSDAIRQEKESEAHGNSHFESFQKLREIPRAFTKLIVNPAFTFLSLAGASEGFLISGFAAFLPKVIENEYSISAGFSAILMGVITVPAGGGGTFLGGYIVKKWDLKCAAILKLCIWSSVICMVFIGSFLLSCPNGKFAGLNTPYSGRSQISLTDPCNNPCGCSLQEWEPICGVDGIAYYSPCHAGCTKEFLFQGNKAYSGCACIERPSDGIPSIFKALPPISNETFYDAQNIACESTCGHLWPFVCLAFCVMVSTFVATMPALSATLRCVRDEQRTFALGIQWLVVRVFGTIPAPMLFGVLIDRTCILWEQRTCDNDSGSCHIYDNTYMSRYMLGIAAIGKACSLLFFFSAWWLYVPPTQATPATANGKPMEVNANRLNA